jgi:hemerythrin-like domain-containing protein
MKKATENLENDHVHILHLIAVMEQIVNQKASNIEHIESIVNLIRNFADGLHHAKEENLLFPKMVEKGFLLQQGPIAVMMHEHVLGRNFVKGISDNISLYKSGNMAALADIHKNMKGYADLLKAHIDKENNVLFRMADNALNAEEQQSLLDQFNTIESNLTNGKSVASFIEHINILTAIYDI